MRLTSLLRGGGQEQGRRSGTENILGITGFGAAATAASGDVAHFRDMAGWRDAFEAEVSAARPDVALFRPLRRVLATPPVLLLGKILRDPGHGPGYCRYCR